MASMFEPFATPSQLPDKEKEILELVRSDGFSAALDRAESELVEFKKSNNIVGQATMLNIIARISFVKKDYIATAQAAEQAMIVVTDSGNKAAEAVAMNMVAKVRLTEGNGDEADKLARDALDIFKLEKSTAGQAASLNMISQASIMRGKKREALKLANEAQQLFVTADDQKGQGLSMLGIVEIHIKSSEIKDAELIAEKAADVFKRAGDKLLTAQAMQWLASLFFGAGEYEKGTNLAYEALANYRLSMDKRGRGATMSAMAQAHLERGNIEEARHAGEESAQIFQKLGDKQMEAQARYALAATVAAEFNMALNEGRQPPVDPETVVQLMSHSLTLYRDADDPHGEAQARYAFAHYALTSDINLALRMAHRSKDLFEMTGDAFGMAMALSIIAQVRDKQNNPDEGLRVINKAIRIFKELGDKVSEDMATEIRAKLQGMAVKSKKKESKEKKAEAPATAGASEGPPNHIQLNSADSILGGKDRTVTCLFDNFRSRAARASLISGGDSKGRDGDDSKDVAEDTSRRRRKSAVYQIVWQRQDEEE